MRVDDEDWIEYHAALEDGARLQALEAKHIYDATGLRPTNEKILKGFKTLGVPPRLRDHMRWVLTGRIKCGAYWINIPRYADRAHCSLCKQRSNLDIMESEQHMWLECENNGQALAWKTTRSIWRKTTSRTWPNISTGLIQA